MLVSRPPALHSPIRLYTTEWPPCKRLHGNNSRNFNWTGDCILINCQEQGPSNHTDTHHQVWRRGVACGFHDSAKWKLRQEYTCYEQVASVITLTYSLVVKPHRSLALIWNRCPFVYVICFCHDLLNFSCLKSFSTSSSHVSLGLLTFLLLFGLLSHSPLMHSNYKLKPFQIFVSISTTQLGVLCSTIGQHISLSWNLRDKGVNTARSPYSGISHSCRKYYDFFICVLKHVPLLKSYWIIQIFHSHSYKLFFIFIWLNTKVTVHVFLCLIN
jgi:hypothetical protein